MLDAGSGLDVHQQAVVAVAVGTAAHIDAGDGVRPEVGGLVDPFSEEQGGGFVVFLHGGADGGQLQVLIVAHDLLAFVSQEELFFAGLGALALVEALGHHGPLAVDELRFEDDGVDERTPAEGRGLLAGRVHQTRGLDEAGELRVRDRRAGVVFFVVHVRVGNYLSPRMRGWRKEPSGVMFWNDTSNQEPMTLSRCSQI